MWEEKDTFSPPLPNFTRVRKCELGPNLEYEAISSRKKYRLMYLKSKTNSGNIDDGSCRLKIWIRPTSVPHHWETLALFAPTRKFGYEKMCRILQLAQLPCAKSMSKIGSWAELETSINSDIWPTPPLILHGQKHNLLQPKIQKTLKMSIIHHN